MNPIQLFELASRQAEWLSVRQQVVATNIANVNTPKFAAKDITPFSAVLDKTGMVQGMAVTQPGHMASNDFSSRNIAVEDEDLNNEIGIQESGNTVALSDELRKTGEIKRNHELNTSLMSSFHRMMLMTVKR
ncbi:MAG: flagellar basal body rod protein FlgB [Alphaproteobacteria bacterium]|jgi:flagellar basal-body rod protein FlgB|uniref:Flagellar basal body rod protein FlgB n=1 Tax=Peteryoungia algae TaxID=2919917 RepID=A0ABT0CVZ4_9HYPH|nr:MULTISPECIES: flagellar basal body rod protein FlgB [unclassified Rhizobium]MBU2327726.1 flagellar basal body rod protein FlgB [Alphaproteobacteria bacterium]MCC8931417.1 flagellar basal body rod protein FlgB [Rhizobium sp. 'Codium 1']MCJ8237330.1 flagellar basal body rod protein FlgB [Rhizobium sp. SSM4.3]